ncbi:3-oxoacyl-(acyl-carrier-) reductase protein [Rutstroemia sp. NJR-2017a BVV2]|nr:3-oxoacyl-(acyl-carrier-) reductase protein [Rutstroemia sp. NJR-2017a BVV2]
MFSLPRTQARTLLRSSFRRTAISSFTSHAYRPVHFTIRPTKPKPKPNSTPLHSRALSTPPQPEPESADALIEQLTDQYGTARDEFEIASEETDKKSIYAADDRAAAFEEWEVLREMYERALEGRFGEEVRTRVGHRIRELERGLEGLEERARED